MTAGPETIAQDMSLAQAAAIMSGHGRKRMPVVDADGALTGMVSRYDLLKTVAEGLRQRPDEPLELPAGAPATVGAIMLADPPAVRADAPVADAHNALLESPLRRVVVVGEGGAVVGIITDGDLMRRAARRLQGGALGRLAAWLSGGEAPEELQVQARGRVASEAMSGPAVTVAADAPVSEAIRLMMAHGVKALPVVGSTGQLVGLVGRAGLLAALGEKA
jgi:CBS domain-containing protein